MTDIIEPERLTKSYGKHRGIIEVSGCAELHSEAPGSEIARPAC
jgi:hypothetical protein